MIAQAYTALSDTAQVNPMKPAVARIYNYWLGGKDHFAADRQEAERLTRVYPLLPRHARENRLFLGRAVRWLAREGIRQFIDVGAGLPTARNTHQIAQAVDPSCRVAYVDNDPMVVTHSSALLAGDPGVTAFWGDLAEPGDILAELAIGDVIDLARPVAVILGLVLDLFDEKSARGIMTSFAGTVADGSYVAVSAGSWDENIGGRLTAEYQAATLHNHSPGHIAGFFGGLTMVRPPGLCDARNWLAGRAVPPLDTTGGHVLAAVARKA